MKVFLMFIFCVSGGTTCDVRWSRAMYHDIDDCRRASVAIFELDGRKDLRGALCEIAKRAPKSYRIDAKAVP